MATNTNADAQLRAARAERNPSRGRGNRAQMAATLRWLRELRPVPPERAGSGPPAGTTP
jgi:hypothetical protein